MTSSKSKSDEYLLVIEIATSTAPDESTPNYELRVDEGLSNWPDKTAGAIGQIRIDLPKLFHKVQPDLRSRRWLLLLSVEPNYLRDLIPAVKAAFVGSALSAESTVQAKLLTQRELVHDGWVKQAQAQKKLDSALGVAIDALAKVDSELGSYDLRDQVIRETRRLQQLRQLVNPNCEQHANKDGSSKSRCAPVDQPTPEELKLINEAQRLLKRFEMQKGAGKLDFEAAKSDFQIWLKGKAGTEFKTLDGRKQFADWANRIAVVVGCGFVCPCSQAFAKLAAYRVGTARPSFLLMHTVDRKTQNHNRSEDFPDLSIRFLTPLADYLQQIR